VTTLTNSFEGGTSGTTITPGNSGGVSGNAFDVVNIGASAALAYSNTQAAHGTLSGEFTEPGTSTTCFAAWAGSLTGSSLATIWYRAYVYLPALPPVTNMRLIAPYDSTSICAGIAVSTAGKIVVQAGTTDTTQYTSTSAVNTAGWFRLEGFVTGSASAGQVSMALYNSPDSATATETFTSAASLNTTGAITSVRFGSSAQGTNYSWFMDDLGASSTGPVGPVVSPAAGGGSSIVPVLVASM
jgi:hypothetical protein